MTAGRRKRRVGGDRSRLCRVDIACVAPHPDDAELCCGGLLVKAKRSGLSIGIIDCTRGEMATRGSVRTRAREAAAADRLLGTDCRVNLRLADGGLHTDRALYRPLVGALRQMRPRLVLAPHWRDQHPDHAAVGQAIAHAAWLCGAPRFDPASAEGVAASDRVPYRPELILHYQNRYGIVPDLIVDISDTYLTKLELAGCYGSQFGPAAATANRAQQPMTKLSSEAFAGWFQAMHGFYGSRIGVAWGEPYCLQSPLAVRSVDGLLRACLG